MLDNSEYWAWALSFHPLVGFLLFGDTGTSATIACMHACSDSLSFPKLLFSELSMHYSLNCSLYVRLHLLPPPPAEYNHFLVYLLTATKKLLRTEYNEIYCK